MKDPTHSADWRTWPLTEKLVQLAAYHCDQLKVQEIPPGSNKGPWVDKYLLAANATPGQPWCAAFVTWCLLTIGYSGIPSHPAAVASWAAAFNTPDHRPVAARRGDLFYFLHPNGTGHIGIVVSATPTTVNTIEGNSNNNGSTEGYEIARNTRQISHLTFIRL